MIGDLVEMREGLEIYCTWHRCHHRAYWPPAKAVRLLGAATTFEEATRRLRCHACGARGWGPMKDVSCRPSIKDHYSHTGAEWRRRWNYDIGQEKQPYDDYWLGLPNAEVPPRHHDDGAPPPLPLYGETVCNDYRVKIPPAGYVEGFSQLKLPFKWATGGPPNLEPRDDVRIKDVAPIVRWTGDAAELAMLPWSWDQKGRPVFNFRSEGRDFSKSDRVLIPADGFYEFTTPADPRKKLKDKWLFTLRGAPWFWIAGIVKQGAFTILTVPPGEDASPAVLQPLAPGSVNAQKVG